ncbi:MAG: histone H1-like protein [Acidobacteriaceae bacterium]|nr:histone H1-like protein [Acidobacteriaceae bacterium]
MATKKTSSTKKSSSGSGPKSKKIVKSKMQKTMHEFKHHELESGRGGKVKNPKQAIAIGLSEARRAGANIPSNPSKKKTAAKKKSAVKKTAKKTAAKSTAHKSAAKKTSAKKTASKKTAAKKTAAKKTAARKK